MKLSDFVKDIVDHVPKKKEGDSVLNPSNHFNKFIESHRFKGDTNALTFFVALQDLDTFFKTENMPETWSIRTYAAGIATLKDIISYEKCKSFLIDNEIDVDKLLEHLEEKRKLFLSTYKKEKRKEKQAKTQQSPSIVESDDDAPHEIILDPMEKETTESTISALCNNDDLILRHKVQIKIQHIVSMLEKYMQHEQDEFKVVFLEVVKDHMLRVTTDL